MIKCKSFLSKYTFAIVSSLFCFLLYAQIAFLNNALQQEAVVVTSKTPDLTQPGLRIYKPEKSYNGYTLFAHLSLELPDAMDITPVYLIDMRGNIVYQWMIQTLTFHAQLRSNGHLLYNTTADTENLFKKGELNNPQDKSHGLHEIDLQGNEIWYYPAFIEHDFQILDNGNILIEQEEPIYKSVIINRDNDPTKYSRLSPLLEIISPDKKVMWSWHGDQHLDELKTLTESNLELNDDWAHNNTCKMLNDNPSGIKDTRFRKGNIIFSYSHLDLIGIIEYPTGKIVWTWGPGIIQGQHAPSMLDNGNILIFDNGSNRGWSRVIELNPLTEEIVWEYRSNPKEDFFSRELSSTERLPNGNTFITDASKNRLFEITPEGEIVWDFISTFNKMTGGEGIFHAYRYSPEHVKPLLELIERTQTQ